MHFQANLLPTLRCTGHTAQTLYQNMPVSRAVPLTTPPHKAEPQSSEIQGDYSNNIPSFVLMNQVPLAFPVDSQADLLWSHRGT